jgi:hypothetical protein
MAFSVTEKMIQQGYDEWSYPFVYGVLASALGEYLRGELSRESITAQFACMELEREAFSNAVASGLTIREAFQHVVGLKAYIDNRVSAAGETQPPADVVSHAAEELARS